MLAGAVVRKAATQEVAKEGTAQVAKESAEKSAENTAQTSSLSPQSESSSQFSELSQRFQKLDDTFKAQPTPGHSDNMEKQSEDLHSAFQKKFSEMKPEPRAKLVEEIEGFLGNANSGLQHNAQNATNYSAGQLLGQADQLAKSLNGLLAGNKEQQLSQLQGIVKSAAEPTHPNHTQGKQFLESLSTEAKNLNITAAAHEMSAKSVDMQHLAPKIGH